MMRYYYVNRGFKAVHVFDQEAEVMPAGVEFLGSTDNPMVKSAVGSFLKGEEGYMIYDETK